MHQMRISADISADISARLIARADDALRGHLPLLVAVPPALLLLLLFLIALL